MKIMNVFKGVWKDEPPCNHYDIPAMEKWLEEQARNGRQFKAWPNRFDAAEPCDCRFSIQPVPENEWKGPAPERLEAYREAGWEYLGNTDYNAFWVWRSIRPDPEELNTDPEADSYAYQSLWKELRLRNALFLAILLAADVLCIWLLGRSRHVLLDTICGEGLTFYCLLYGMVAMINTVIRARELYILKKTMENLQNGLPMSHRKDYSGRGRLPLAVRYGGLVVLLLLALIAAPTEREVEKLAEMQDPPRYLTAESLGGEHNKNQQVVQSSTIFGGKFLEVVEGDASFNGRRLCFEHQMNLYSMGLLARPILWEVVHGYIQEDAGVAAEPFDQTVFDEAFYLLSDQGVQHLAVRQGGEVLYFRTTAPADLRQRLTDLAELMA